MSRSTDTPSRPLTHCLSVDVNIFDTDCFGVMWHGAYTKWMEMGRVRVMEGAGLVINGPDAQNGWIYPVVEQNLRFKSRAPYGDKLTLNTTVRAEGYRLLFDQVFVSETTGKPTLEAQTTCVVLDMAWKLQRKLPPEIARVFE